MKAIAVEIKWGLRFTVVALLWMFVEKYSGLHGENIAQHPIYTNLFAVVAIVLYVLALRDKRSYQGGSMTWREGFISGMIVTAVIVVLSPLAQWMSHTWISPDYFPNIINHSVESGELTREEAEDYFNLKNYIKQSMAFAMVMGAVTSALVSVFLKRT